jgi:hypothetical protein
VATIERILNNEDAMQRLLIEFDNVDDLGSLRKCNKQVLQHFLLVEAVSCQFVLVGPAGRHRIAIA